MCKEFAERFPAKVDEYENLLTGNPIWVMRTKGVARPERGRCDRAWEPRARRCAAAGWTSICGATCRTPATRNSSSKYRLRTEGDVFARYMCRVTEMRESIGIVQQALDGHAGRTDQGGCAEGCPA